MSARRVAVSALIAAGLLVTAAGVATANLQTWWKSKPIAADGNGAVTAKCPRGSEAVSGGFAGPRFDPAFNGRSILPFTSKRAGNRKWKTRGYNFADTQSGRLISIAYCDTHEPGLKVRSRSIVLPAFDPGSVTARCPRGSEAVSGGFTSPDATTSGDVVFPITSKRVTQRKWKVSAYNNDPANSQRLVAFAYCDTHQPGLKPESKRVMVPLAQKRPVTARCHHGRKVFSGGFAATVDTNANGAFPFASKKANRRKWRAAAVGNGMSGGPFPFKVLAYCKS